MKTEIKLTQDEIDYVKTCWEQMYHAIYTYDDYLKLALEDKKRKGTVY